RNRADEGTPSVRVADLDAEECPVRVDHLAVSDDLGGDVRDEIARDRETDAGGATATLRVGRRERGDSDHTTLDVDQRAAGVARIDGRARLDDGRQGDVVRLGHRD